jgi:hypothetical protein
MAPAASRAASSELPKQARFLRSFTSTTKRYDDLYQWDKQVDSLVDVLLGLDAPTRLQLSSGDLLPLVFSSLAHGLELLATAAESTASSINTKDEQSMVVLATLAISANKLVGSCASVFTSNAASFAQTSAAVELALAVSGEFNCSGTCKKRLVQYIAVPAAAAVACLPDSCETAHAAVMCLQYHGVPPSTA